MKAYWRAVAVLLRVGLQGGRGRVGWEFYRVDFYALFPWSRLLFPFCDLARQQRPAMHVGLPSFRRSAASPENPIAVARKHARPIKYRRPRQGAAGAHERIVLPLKIFVGDGIGLKFYSPISSCHNPSLVARQEGLTCSFAQSSQFISLPGAALRRTYQSFLHTLLPLQVNLPPVFSVIK